MRELEEDDESYFGESYFTEDPPEDEEPGAFSIDRGLLGHEIYDDRNNIEIRQYEDTDGNDSQYVDNAHLGGSAIHERQSEYN